MKTKNDAVRLVIPRRQFLGTTAAFAGMAATGKAALAAGEGGEAGEGAALDELSPDVSFLTVLGQFEATHRIVAGLAAEGEIATAQEHLEMSHHAFYEDIADGLEDRGNASFEAETAQFVKAVESGDADTIASVADAVITAIHRCIDGMDPKDVFEASRQLVLIAAADFGAGVEDGAVTEPQEYRDAWGFSQVAQLWIARLEDNEDAEVSAAAVAASKAMLPTRALFPGLSVTTVDGDASVLFGAAARIEIAALRLG